jgi:nucleoside-diphosphate-sugar epimerase
VKIAVTGASGFVGRHVMHELARHKVDVVAVTRDAKRLGDLSGRFSVIEADIGSASQSQLLQLATCDVLIHLAWDGLPHYGSLHHFEIELPKQYQFLKQLIVGGLKTLVIAGTCFEYGLQSGELTEDLVPVPINSYGYAKDSLRRQLEFLLTEHHSNFTWARLFYTYGEGQPATSVYSQLKSAVLRGERQFDMSGGQQLRDYLPVTEVAKYLVALGMLCRPMGIVNICSGRPVSVIRQVEDWIASNNWDIRPNPGVHPYPAYEPMAFWGSNAKLSMALDLS